MKEDKNIIEQIKDNPIEKYNGNLTREKLKEAVEYLFKTQPREKAKNGKGNYIDVIQTDTQLSIKVQGDSLSMRTGIKGLFALIDTEGSWVYRTLPIKFNGIVLDDEQTKQFWEQTEKMRSNENKG